MYLSVTGKMGMNQTETVSSRDYQENEEPQFTFGIKDGLAEPGKIRGRHGTLMQKEDLVEPQDQALLEWMNIEFFVPVKKPT